MWTAYLMVDITIFMAAAAVATVLWAALSKVWYHLEYVFIILSLYGLASTLFAYAISLFAHGQLASFAWTTFLQGVVILAYFMAYICIETFADVRTIDSSTRICDIVMSAVAPMGSAVRALFIATNLFSTACEGQMVSKKPTSFPLYGGPIFFLAIQCFVLFGIVLRLDGGSADLHWEKLARKWRQRIRPAGREGVDEETAHEQTGTHCYGTTQDGLRVVHLTKSFGKNTAIDDVTLGIKHGEVFALLGPNGAGKSTTISLIRGNLRPSDKSGDIMIENESMSRNWAAARRHLGACPRTDALDQMTVREHLEFYGHIRGIPDFQHNVSVVLRAVGLQAFEKRMGHALSGGIKRKLSLGIALMGNPSVLLLDEPSSGLDAAAKRIMWQTLVGAGVGRSILLTTHSMEEADALAGRIGIMACRMLATGTAEDLKHRFADTLYVHLVAKTAQRTSDDEIKRMVAWIRSTLPSAKLETETYHGQMRFSVEASAVMAAVTCANRNRPEAQSIGYGDDRCSIPASSAPGHTFQCQGSAMGQLVVLLEQHKAQIGVEHYSVSPATLDRVFTEIVSQHSVKDEPEKAEDNEEKEMIFS